MQKLRSALVGIVALVGLTLVAAAPIGAQAPIITDAAKECILDVPYPLLDATIEPAGDIEVARVYFRASQFPEFYWVKMEPAAGVLEDPTAPGFAAVIPAPSPETESVVFYVEAVSGAFESSRTDDFVTMVVSTEGECDGDPLAVYTGEPQIVVGTTVSGAAAVPPGFSGIGIVGGVAGGVVAAGIPGWVIGAGVVGGVVAGAIIIDDNPPRQDDTESSPINP